MLDLEIIRVGCDAASKGPWTWLEGHIGRSLLSAPNDSVLHITGPGAVDPTRINICADDDNAAFIAHAREDIPALIVEVEELRKALMQIDSIAYNGFRITFGIGYERVINIARAALKNGHD